VIDRGAGVFLNTGYLVALKDADVQNDPTAREHFDGAARGRDRQRCPAFLGAAMAQA
jgi:hypothetical protein